MPGAAWLGQPLPVREGVALVVGGEPDYVRAIDPHGVDLKARAEARRPAPLAIAGEDDSRAVRRRHGVGLERRSGQHGAPAATVDSDPLDVGLETAAVQGFEDQAAAVGKPLRVDLAAT